jgi:hypothetical protein
MSVYYGTYGIRTLTQGLDRRSTLFFKKCWVVDLTLDRSNFDHWGFSFPINWQLGPSRVRSTTFHVFKNIFKTPETGAHKSAHQPQPTVVTNCTVFSVRFTYFFFLQKNVQKSSLRFRHKQHFKTIPAYTTTSTPANDFICSYDPNHCYKFPKGVSLQRHIRSKYLPDPDSPDPTNSKCVSKSYVFSQCV